MTPVLTVVLVFLGLIVVGFAALVLWVRHKVRRVKAWLKIQGLEMAAQEMRNKQAQVDQPVDPERDALLARVQAAYEAAKKAYDEGRIGAANEAADPVCLELLKFVEQKMKEQEEKERQARDNPPAALETPLLALPAPDERRTADKLVVDKTVDLPDGANTPVEQSAVKVSDDKPAP